MKPKAIARNLIYASPWVNLYVDRVEFPNGTLIDQHHLLDFERASVMALPLGADGRYLMVKVDRYPTGRSEWEFPAGRVEKGEEIFTAAQREVLEETGYSSEEYQLLYSYHPFNGIANALFHIVVCAVGEPLTAFDFREISAVSWFSSEEIWQRILSGELMDGFTLTAFLLHSRIG